MTDDTLLSNKEGGSTDTHSEVMEKIAIAFQDVRNTDKDELGHADFDFGIDDFGWM